MVSFAQDRKKEAVKKVIAAMTVGKDVSMLFTDVLNCMQTKNLELKKLVYLYVMNYAKTHPDRVVLAVNTFQLVRCSFFFYNNRCCVTDLLSVCLSVRLSVINTQDSQDPNPLVRALAIRTMGQIRVESIAEHLVQPLQKTMKVSSHG